VHGIVECVERRDKTSPRLSQNTPSTGSSSYLNGELPLGEVDLALALLVGGTGGLVLGETAAELTGELGAEIKRSVLLALVEETQLGALVRVDDGHHASDRLANIATV